MDDVRSWYVGGAGQPPVPGPVLLRPFSVLFLCVLSCRVLAASAVRQWVALMSGGRVPLFCITPSGVDRCTAYYAVQPQVLLFALRTAYVLLYCTSLTSAMELWWLGGGSCQAESADSYSARLPAPLHLHTVLP